MYLGLNHLGLNRQGGVAPFSPSSLYAGSAKGLWYDTGDLTSMFQESGGTTPAVVGQPIGKFNDLSGNGLHGLQATSAARPVLASGPASATLDGIDDGFATAAFAAGTLGADMTLMVPVRRAAATDVVLAFQTSGAGVYCGLAAAGIGALAYSNAGTPTHLVNGVAVPGGTATTAGQLHTALPVGEWCILEIRNLDMTGCVHI